MAWNPDVERTCNMPETYLNGRFVSPDQVDYQADGYWNDRRLSPSHLLVHDVVLQPGSQEASAAAAVLEMQERLSSSFLPALNGRDWFAMNLKPEKMTQNRQEQLRLKNLASEFGWMNTLRLERSSMSVHEDDPVTKCRWIHISSKFSEYLQGALLALTSNEVAPDALMLTCQELDSCIHQNERFSKHGRYFTPFFQSLGRGTSSEHPYPLLLSIPFLDWSIDGPTPPLRFQVDPREGYQSGRSSAHLLRSILEHFYRLEDTNDREHKQVFNRHKPWSTDRDLDLKVRRWYGHYPTALNVDELWILAVDESHIVSFSSNQSWKSRWPPLQLASRVAEVSFRGVRNSLLLSEQSQEYTALIHVIASLSGAVGILHRSFWAEIPLCLTDRYAGYLSHLQYRLYRSPSTKLVTDLLQVQEELNIVIQVTQQQSDLIDDIQDTWFQQRNTAIDRMSIGSRAVSHASASAYRRTEVQMLSVPDRATFRQPSSSTLSDPLSQLVENLQRELADLRDLRDNTNSLVTRTVRSPVLQTRI